MFGTRAARKSGKAVSGLSAAQEETLGGDVDGANRWYPLQFIKILSGGSLKILRFSLHEHALTPGPRSLPAPTQVICLLGQIVSQAVPT